jgi:hypothetical protein
MKCEVCTGEFEPKKPNQKVCSARCRKAKWRRSHADGAQEASPATLNDLPELDEGGMRGRPVGLTPRIQEIICEAIAAGNYQKVAARAAGISEGTLLKWRARGRRGEEPYLTLELAIEEAEHDCEKRLVAKVMAATSVDWRAAAMMLERKYPDRWSKIREREWEANGGAVAQTFVIIINLGDDDRPPPAIETVAEALPAPRAKDPDPDPTLN